MTRDQITWLRSLSIVAITLLAGIAIFHASVKLKEPVAVTGITLFAMGYISLLVLHKADQ